MKSFPVIFLHGGPGLPEYMEEVFKFALPKTIRPYFYQQLTGPNVTIHALLEQLSDQLGGIGSENICMLGHSWGGTLALEYLKRKKDVRVKKVILLATPISRKMWFDDYQEELTKHALTHASPDDIYLTPEEKQIGLEHFQRILGQVCEPMLQNIQENYVRDLDLTQFVSELDIPTLNIIGRKDHRVPYNSAKQIGELNPLVTNFDLPEAGHLLYLLPSNLKVIAQKVSQFLDT